MSKGLADMKARPEYYQQFDSPNGWGLHNGWHNQPTIKRPGTEQGPGYRFLL